MSTLPMQSIFKFSISILLLLVLCSIQAQEKVVEKKAESKLPDEKFMNGFTVQVDVASVFNSIALQATTRSVEGGVQFDLRHKYFPIVEFGLADVNKISNNDIGFKTNGFFGRLGVDFNLRKQKKDALPTNNLFLGGLRLGMTSFGYDVKNVVMTDDYWGGSELPDYTNKKANKLWFEIVMSVRVEVFRNVFMGWSVRSKNLIGQDKLAEVFPWYIPGYGINKSGNWGFNYMIGYHF